jgi:hypothetical protein
VPWLLVHAFFADHSLLLGMILRSYMAALYLRSPFVHSLRIPALYAGASSVVVAFVNKDRSILHGRPFLTRPRASFCCCCCRRCMTFPDGCPSPCFIRKKQAARAPALGKSEGKIRGGSRSARTYNATNEAATIAVPQQVIAPCLGGHSSF